MPIRVFVISKIANLILLRRTSKLSKIFFTNLQETRSDTEEIAYVCKQCNGLILH